MTDPQVARPLKEMMASAVYLQVSTISQALIFVTRARGWSFLERPGLPLLVAFLIAQLIATIISATVTWNVAGIQKIGWEWTGVIWLYNIVTYMLLDPLKFAVRYVLSGRAWCSLAEQRTAFTSKKDFGKESQEVAWPAEHWTQQQHGRDSFDMKFLTESSSFRYLNLMAEEAKKCAEVARLRELQTVKGWVDSNARLRGLDIDDMNHHYTV
ncbi:ATPase 7, plasma membrane-type [Ancistrocladus abbreviatus]